MPSPPRQKRVRLKPQDPFDLIRLLARSQSDPRKAVAELVQNSLDAGAQRIEITWLNIDKQRALRVLDNGEGIFPELERADALERVARTIGHSHKRDLSPVQRREEMVLGRYGIGLIGFWSVGHEMHIKSRVAGGTAHVLRLVEDHPTAEVKASHARRVEEYETYTEITIRGIHGAATGKIRPPRLQAYLAEELRGQLLARDATVTIRDRVARGRARKLFTVKARPFLGTPVEDLRNLAVEGCEDARIELYTIAPGEDRRGVVTLSCGGTTVLEDLALIDGNDAPRAPWSGGRIEGVVDFPDFAVAPSTRRGLVHDEPLAAFLAALPRLESALAARLAGEDERRAREHHENLARDIRRVFSPVARLLPDYELFELKGEGAGSDSDPNSDSPATAPPADGELVPRGAETPLSTADPIDSPNASSIDADQQPDPPETEEPILYPPGPLATAELRPKTLRIPNLATRGLSARALDADGRAAAGQVTWSWRLDGPGELEPDGARARYTAPDPSLEHDSTATIHAEARVERPHSKPLTADARADIHIVAPQPSPADARGIPDPVPVNAPGESWRSRVRGNAWEFNEGHKDYRAACSSEARRLRYLILLFSKEVVLRNFGGAPADAELLERMVEIQACLDAKRKSGERPQRGKGPSNP